MRNAENGIEGRHDMTFFLLDKNFNNYIIHNRFYMRNLHVFLQKTQKEVL